MNKSNFNGLLLVGIMVIGVLAIPANVSATTTNVVSSYTAGPSAAPYFSHSLQANGNHVYSAFVSSTTGTTYLLKTENNGSSWTQNFSASLTSGHVNIDATNSTLFFLTQHFDGTHINTTVRHSVDNATNFVSGADIQDIKDACVINKDNLNVTVIGLVGANQTPVSKYVSSDGGATFTGPTTIMFGSSGAISDLACSQHDGLGKLDIIVGQNPTSTNERLAILSTSDFGNSFALNNATSYTGTGGAFISQVGIPQLKNGVLTACIIVDPDGAATTTAGMQYHLIRFTSTTLGEFIYSGNVTTSAVSCNSYLYNGNILTVFTKDATPNTYFALNTNTSLVAQLIAPENVVSTNYAAAPFIYQMPDTSLKMNAGKASVYTAGAADYTQYNLTVNNVPNPGGCPISSSSPPSGVNIDYPTSNVVATSPVAIISCATPYSGFNYVNTSGSFPRYDFITFNYWQTKFTDSNGIVFYRLADGSQAYGCSAFFSDTNTYSSGHYYCTTNATIVGDYNLTIEAFDYHFSNYNPSRATTTDALTIVSSGSNIPPVIDTITRDPSGTLLKAQGFNITVTAHDPDGTIASITVTGPANYALTDPSSPYVFTIIGNCATPQQYNVTALDNGGVTSSQLFNVTFDNSQTYQNFNCAGTDPNTGNLTATNTGTLIIPGGGEGGGYVGTPTTFFGFNISYLATQFGISVTAVQWLLGILVVALVLYGLGSQNPIVIGVAILLGVGLAVLFGLFPVWLLLVLVFLLILLVARLFFGGGGGDEM